MKFIIIFGPPAVGKMTVGYELEKLTKIPLFHNHATIEIIVPIFDFGTPQFSKLVGEFRRRMFEEVAIGKGKGLIFTFVWGFDLESEHEYVREITRIFEKEQADVYFVELEADIETRKKRNTHEFRLDKKPTKRDINSSKKNLLKMSKEHRLNSFPGEIQYKNYLKIDNTDISPEETAQKIQSFFGL